MAKISEMPRPPLSLSGLELLPVLQGSDNAGLPLLALGPLPTGAVLQLRAPMLADKSATSDADPGAGKLRWNHATPASATVLYIDDADATAADISAAWAALTVGGYVYVQAATDPADATARANWQKWSVTSVTAASGYAKIGVALVSSAGAFADADPLEVTIQQPTLLPGTRTRQSATTTATLTPAVTDEMCTLSAQAGALAVAAPAGAWSDGEPLLFRFKATGAHGLTWDAVYRGIGGTLPTAMVSGKWMYLTAFRNSADSKFDVILPAAVQS